MEDNINHNEEYEDYIADEESFEDKSDVAYQNSVKKSFIEKTERSIFELYRRYQREEIDISPYYQRKAMWPRPRQSKLIESILLEIPIQVIYLSESEEGTYYEVVDGQQRLTAFFEFLDNRFKLEKLTVLFELNGKYFKELDIKLQRKIEDYMLTVYIIKKESDKEAKFDIFERINVGSTNLNAQEIRNCIFRGDPINLLRKLAENDDFARLVKKPILEKRMKDEELVLRFLSFYTKPIDEYTGNLTVFLNDTLQQFNIYKDKFRDIEYLFRRSMKNIMTVFGDQAFVFNPSSTQINFALFDILSTTFADLDEKYVELFKDEILNKYNELKDDFDFIYAITSNTSTKNNVKTRFDLWNNALNSIL